MGGGQFEDLRYMVSHEIEKRTVMVVRGITRNAHWRGQRLH